MSWWSTIRAVGGALGIDRRDTDPVGCSLGTTIYRETKRATYVVNVFRRPRPLDAATIAVAREWFPELDVGSVRIRTRCRLPPNRFATTGDIYAMTFGSTVCFRGEFDPADPVDLVKLAHELVHVDQVRRLGGETRFACAYGEGYLGGGGRLPAYLDEVTAYHRNPLEAEAYTFESRFRDDRGRVVASRVRPD